MPAKISALPVLSEAYSLSHDHIQSYAQNGHIVLRNVASRSEVNAYRPFIQEIVREVAAKRDTQGRIEDYSSLFQQVTNVWTMREALRGFVFARRFARIAADLMGVDGVRLYHDQALFKPANGKATPWHQDQFYWPLDTRHTITMWMPLIDLSREMGTMFFASGSHLDGPLVDLSISQTSDELFRQLIRERGFSVAHCELNAGDATFHSGWTAHGAHPNMSGRIREAITIIYYADGTRLMQPDNEFRKVDMEVFHPGQKPGEFAASPLNPLLYRRNDQ
jgi:ectoine hydroxylase-related dioxygenase (phytanoyl-CoA dioxygenase family)